MTIQNFKSISDNYASRRTSYRLVPVGDSKSNVGNSEVKAIGLWGRFVRSLTEFFRPEAFTQANQKVMADFRAALNSSCKASTMTSLEIDLKSLEDRILQNHKSLRARDVKEILEKASQLDETVQVQPPLLTETTKNVDIWVGKSEETTPSFQVKEDVLSDNIKNALSQQQLKLCGEIYNESAIYKNKHNLSKDEMYALITVTYRDSTFKPIYQDLSGAKGRESTYASLLPAIESALIKIPNSAGPFIALLQDLDGSSYNDNYKGNVGKESVCPSIFSTEFTTQSNEDLLPIVALENQSILVTYNTKIGKTVELSDGVRRNKYVIFAQGSKQSTSASRPLMDPQDMDIEENELKELNNVYNIKYDEKGNIESGWIVNIEVT